MRISDVGKNNFYTRDSKSDRASSRTAILIAASFILGIAFSSAWYLRCSKNKEAVVVYESVASVALSDSTRSILQHLASPLEIRFFSPTKPMILPEKLRGFVSRIELLLTECERVADGKIHMIHSDPQTDSGAKSIAGDLGVLPSSGTDGEIYYLGLAVLYGKRTEVISQLSPEWEAALESDLSRAILRVSASAVSPALSVSRAMASPTPIDPEVSEELLKMFPDLESRPFNDAAKTLREVALEELKSATIEMQTKVEASQTALAVAREQKNESEQQAALKRFQGVQHEQAKKIKQITARLQERITVLQRLKNAGHETEPAK